MNSPTFFTCKEKKGILGLITGEKTEILKCIEEHFEELDSTKSEGAGEKHLPCVKTEGSLITVSVGSVLHPMTEDHSIGWIYLETAQGGQIKFLCPDKEPIAEFCLSNGDKAIAAYAYCNLHGFWKTEI